MQWKTVEFVLSLPIAQDWGMLFRARVACASGVRIQLEASRATLEAVGRALRTRKWRRRHTSKNRVDRRADSRYYQSPTNSKFVIRISNHAFPGGTYHGAKDYVITPQIMTDYNVLGLIRMIETDERAFNVHVRKHQKKMEKHR